MKQDGTEVLTRRKLNDWYMSQDAKTRRVFKEIIYENCLFDKETDIQKADMLKNWRYGRSKIPALVAPLLFEAVVTVDSAIEDINNIIPHFKTKGMDNIIHKLCVQHNLTQKELAKRASLSRVTVTMVANNLTTPTLPTMQAIAAVFGMPIASIFDLEPKTKTA